jgi:hypothetical protein
VYVQIQAKSIALDDDSSEGPTDRDDGMVVAADVTAGVAADVDMLNPYLC